VPLLLLKGLDSLTNPSARPSGRCNKGCHRPRHARSRFAPWWAEQPTTIRPNGLVKTANGPARKSLCHHDTIRDPVLDGAVVY